MTKEQKTVEKRERLDKSKDRAAMREEETRAADMMTVGYTHGLSSLSIAVGLRSGTPLKRRRGKMGSSARSQNVWSTR